MRSIKSLKNIKGKRIIVRADFNVPVDGARVRDGGRIMAALPTLLFLKKKGAKIVIISHIGRDAGESLKPAYTFLKKHIAAQFVPELFGTTADKAIANMKNGDVLLLENLRSDSREKAGNMQFAKALAVYGDIYINEAFPVSHRADSSIVLLPKLLPAYAGIQLEKEVKELSKALNPKHPFLFIQGGAKAETKIPLIKRYLKTADQVFVGGELADDFYAAANLEIGKSMVDKGIPDLKPLLKHKKLILPATVVVKKPSGESVSIPADEIKKGDKILDIGGMSIEGLASYIKKAKLVLWNGPMGWYEGGYTKATEQLLSMLASAKAETIIAGGDTAVLADKKKYKGKFSFVSTGGGATLEFLAKGTLIGIKALK